jgi:recombination protein RecT
MRDKFAAALPAHIPADRFVRTAITAVLKSDIDKVCGTPGGRQSVYESLLKAAADGLLVDGREAALVAFGSSAAYMPMVAGVMKKARNSGEIAAIFCQGVYENDVFKVSLVTDGCPITHEPNWKDRGDVVGVYALCRFKDGTWSQPEVMSVDQVNAIKARSRSGNNGPWKTDWLEMARKTVIRRAAKYWPSSTDKDGVDIADLVRRDDEIPDLSVIDVAPAATPTRKKSGAAAKALAAPAEPEREPDEDHTAEQGDDV